MESKRGTKRTRTALFGVEKTETRLRNPAIGVMIPVSYQNPICRSQTENEAEMTKSLIAILFLVLCPVLIAQRAMNNDAIIKLVKAGLSDDLIISTINSSPGTYDTSADGLIALKKAGASDKLVQAILSKGPGTAQSSPNPSSVPENPPIQPGANQPVQPGVTAAVPVPPDFHSTDGKLRIFVTDKPISEYTSISRGWNSSSHSATGDDPRTVEIQADIVKFCPSFVIASNNPNRADYVLVFRRRGGQRSSMYALGGLSGLALSAAQKVNGASLFQTDGDMVFASKENTVEKSIKDICDHIPAPVQN